MDIKLEETERAIDDEYREFRNSRRERKPTGKYPFNEDLSATYEELTYDNIKFLPEAEQSIWESAMNEEMLTWRQKKSLRLSCYLKRKSTYYLQKEFLKEKEMGNTSFV
ncbi:hypothetical protein AVEN_146225-1 [Araneus ventricosus]|uniref:Uncharacterized protein n=1 Tax=Araneus ventricosus TaxID=182803 RepID=A0A4Y2NZX3_ARAVE|nr:hypothetical protein AVEN_146225-1 [Araneus ventricosus]